MANSQTYPQERVRIFDREGFTVAEFRASVERSLVIGGEGRAEFNYPSRKTDIVNDKVLRFGNWLLVESDSLPAWVGVIDTPRAWSPRVVAVHAYTPDRVFGWRRGPLEEKLVGSAGAIFEKLIVKVNQPETTVIRAGDIWRGGVQMEETINPTPLAEDLQRIVERSGEEYSFRPETDSSGRLVIYADWVQRLGEDTTALLHEGKGGGNIESLNDVFVEDGDIVNDVLAYGDGLSWKSKPTQIVSDPKSGQRYGLRQTSEAFSGVSNTTTLKNNGTERLQQSAETIKLFHVNALNVGDTYKYLRLGNRLALRLENIGFIGGGLGFETNVRIAGMVMSSEEKNVVELVLEEVIYV
jgi:hypothetical protein